MDIEIRNKALLLKQLHKFLNKVDTPWINIVWESYYSNSLLGRIFLVESYSQAPASLQAICSAKQTLEPLHFCGMINGGINHLIPNFLSYTLLQEIILYL